jgi:cellulose synthase/poly-beta-1,6-N-acetylglucosamine synthase-like glycosyltransferase
MFPSVCAVIPTHDGAECIEATVRTLAAQTVVVDVYVVSDNNTDRTVEIIAKLQTEFPNLFLMESVNNRAKKAGALNQGLLGDWELLKRYDFVWIQDDDTVVAPDIIQRGIEKINQYSELGVVISRAGVQPMKAESGPWRYWHFLLQCLQEMEYAGFDAERVGTWGNIKVAHGMAALFRAETMEEVVKYRKKRWNTNGVYDEANITEDYELTLCIKSLSEHNRIGLSMKMLALTDVPVGFGQLFRQRVRWLMGGNQSLIKYGFSRVTIKEAFQRPIFYFFTLVQIYIFALMVQFIAGGGSLSWGGLMVALVAISMGLALYKLRYVPKLRFEHVALTVLYLPRVLYDLTLMGQQVWADVSYLIALIFKKELRW